MTVIIHGLNHRKVWVLHEFNLFASAAIEAWFSRRNGFFAVQGLSEAQSQRPATQTGRSRKKIRMADVSARNVAAKHIHSPFVPE
ncbi:MAG: hypothetical protein OHK003_17150 [Anaerolineales bacterium]